MIYIYNIDCLDGLRQLGENSIDLIVTSPPYYNARDYSQWESVDDYMADMKEIFSMAYNCMKNHHYIIVNVGDVIGQVGKAKWSSRKFKFLYLFMLND